MILKLKCLRCGGSWKPRVENPRMCPICKTPYWDVPRRKLKVKK